MRYGPNRLGIRGKQQIFSGFRTITLVCLCGSLEISPQDPLQKRMIDFGGYVTNRLGIMSQHGPISKEYKSVLSYLGSLNN